MKIPLKSFITVHCPVYHGLSLVLDARDIFPKDPGMGTPRLFVIGRETMTFDCAQDNGSDLIAESGKEDVPESALDWIRSEELCNQADTWLDHFSALAEQNKS